MLETQASITLVVGIILSLLYAERTGVLPAGLVVPGYLALVLTNPEYILITFILSFITFLVVTKVIARFTILYGKRKFTAMLTVGILLNYLFGLLLPIAIPHEVINLSAIGVVIPGLIANTIQKQGLIPTVTSTVALSCITFGITFLYNNYFFI